MDCRRANFAALRLARRSTYYGNAHEHGEVFCETIHWQDDAEAAR